MDGLPDLPTDHGTDRHPPEPKRARGGLWALVIAALLVAAGGAWVLLRKPAPEPTPTVATPAPVPTVVEAPDDAPPIRAEEADAAARTSLDGLSSEPEWAAWLTEKDLLRRLVGAVNAVAEGDSPRANVPFLAPKTPYVVRELEDGRTVVDPASWERYEPLGRVVRDLDTSRVVEAFRSVRPLLEQLHGEGARPGVTFPDTLERALVRIIDLPLPDPEATLVPSPSGVGWHYADPRLEALPAAEKHLLRLGPTLLGELQGKARQLKDALDRE